MPSRFHLKNFPDPQALAHAAARDWLVLLRASSGPYFVALSGGRIAQSFFASVTELATSAPEAFAHVHFFWADERCVPPADPQSNYRLALENLLAPLNVPPERIHRLKGELPPADAVTEACREIRRIIPANKTGIPLLDMVFLGMGEDGHVASLMPNAPPAVLSSREPFVHIPDSPKPPPNRLSMSYPLLAAARNVWVLASGAGKAQAFKDSLMPGAETPLARLLASRRQTLLYNDLNVKEV